MSIDKLNEKKLDEILGQALQKHTESVPADFTERMSRQIREDQERRILAKVVLQERLSLAGCIILGITAIVTAVSFPSTTGSFTEQMQVYVDKVSQTIEVVSYKWQFYMVFAGVFGLCVWAFADLLVGEN